MSPEDELEAEEVAQRLRVAIDQMRHWRGRLDTAASELQAVMEQHGLAIAELEIAMKGAEDLKRKHKGSS